MANGSYKYHLITNAHVLDDLFSEELSDGFFVWNADRTQDYKMNVVGVDRTVDVGVATIITRDDLHVLTLAKSLPKAGGLVSALGNQRARGVVYTAGEINDPQNYVFGNIFPVIHHDANSSSGNSGSPFFNDQAEVIGMHFQSDKRAGATVGFSIPINVLHKSYRAILTHGEHRHGGSLDSHLTMLSSQELSILGVQAKSGYYVNFVISGSEEEAAGLKPGHILLAIDGKPVLPTKWQEAAYRIFQKNNGDDVELTVTSVADPLKREKINYKVEGIAHSKSPTWEIPFGFTVTGLDEVTRREVRNTLPSYQEGVVIRAKQGLQKKGMMPGVPSGAVICRINGRSFKGVEGFKKVLDGELKKGLPIVVEVFGTRQSPLYSGQTSKILLSGLSLGRVTSFEKVGVWGMKVSETEQRALGVSHPSKTAFYVVSENNSSGNLSHSPILRGDILVGYKGQTLDNLKSASGAKVDLQKYLGGLEHKETGRFDVWRLGRKLSLTRELQGERGKIQEVVHDPYFFHAYTLNSGTAAMLGFNPETRGVYIRLAESQEGQKHTYNIASGMVVQAVNGKTVSTREELVAAIERVRKAKEVLLLEVVGSYHWNVPGKRYLVMSSAHYEPSR